MSDPRTKPGEGASSILDRAARGDAFAIERMPQPTIRARVPMRDRVRLDTFVWLPEDTAAPVPAILFRTPYQEHILGWARLGVLKYRDAGYAVVFQVVRGVGSSAGTFSFNGPLDRTDGYDAVEWVAAAPWCDGNVGMDGGSYLGMTQLTAATARPPHLRCIIPSVPTADPFREIPYFGGGFTRQHSLTWTHLISVESLAELSGGFIGVMPILTKPEWLRRVTSRPALAAADELLTGDKLAHYRDVLAHSTFDAWWRERVLGPADWARIGVPALIMSGNFDLSIGALTVWRGLEANAPADVERLLLIGPWDHSGTYTGGGDAYGPYQLSERALLDPYSIRLAFFDRYLKGRGSGPELGGRVKLFLTGLNEWRSFDRFPPAEVAPQSFYLGSGGHANARRGDGTLSRTPPTADQSADRFTDDPDLPFVAALTHADNRLLDLRERASHSETLVYATAPVDRPLTVLGEPTAVLHVAGDVPDADLAVWLAEARPDGRLVQLSFGHLRLRYRLGFDREVLLTPGEIVEARVMLHYVAHQLTAGSRLVLLVAGGNFPWVDPNPHTGGPIATATESRAAEQALFHDEMRPSRVELPVMSESR